MQAGIDMMGVVTSVGQLGSVKRKSDNSELSRRDVTLLDQRWGSNEEEKETKERGTKEMTMLFWRQLTEKANYCTRLPRVGLQTKGKKKRTGGKEKTTRFGLT